MRVSYIQPLHSFYEMGVSVFEGRLVVYIVSAVDLNLQDGYLYVSACDQNSYSLRRHLLFLSQGPVLIAPLLAESPHQRLLQSIATERVTEILRFSLS